MGKDKGESPKPYSFSRARLYVQMPNKRQKGRIAKYKKVKQAAYAAMMKSPYVDISLESQVSGWVEQRALIDTGADWSLIHADQLSQEELDVLTPTDLAGQGVCNETIPIIGEIWRNVRIGPTVVKNHRFIVVKDMITRIILGVDFWCRLTTVVSFDFKNKRLVIPEFGVNVEMYENEEQMDTERCQMIKVRTCQDIKVPARTEMFVQCEARGLQKGDSYVLEPSRAHDGMTCAASCLMNPSDEKFHVRVANVGNDKELLKKGMLLGSLNRACVSTNASSARAFKPVESKFNWVERMGEKLQQNQKEQLVSILDKYQEIFYDGGQLPLVRVGIEHEIGLKADATPIAHRPRRLSPDLEQEVKGEIDELLRTGVIRQSNSPWAAPIACARKPNGKLRLALDYRGSNSISNPATLHHIPRIDDLLDRLGKAKFFTTLDAKSGYYQMPLNPKDSKATAFVVPWGQYEFADRTPFGLKGAGYSFQRMMSAILTDSNYHEALCYLDDVLVWGETWTEHVQRLDRVLDKMQSAGLALSFEKCKFGVEKVQYLGAVIHEGMLTMSDQRVEDLRNIPTPKTVTDLRRAVGAFNYVHQWIPGFSDIAKPLFAEITGKKHRKINWTSECEKAFQEVKERLANAISLKIPDMEEKFTLVTDASDIALGAMLAQTDENDVDTLRPVAFFHKTLSKAEENYNTTEKELLAVVEAIKRFSIYLYRPFNLITDHRALRWLNTLDINDRKGRKGRWIEYLQEFDINPIHKSGKSGDLSMADYLSRANADGSCKIAVFGHVANENRQSHFATTLFEVDSIREHQQLDDQVSKWRQLIMNREADEGSIKTSELEHKEIERMYIDDEGILRVKFDGGRRTRNCPTGTNHSSRIVLPEKLIPKALYLLHDSPLAGHMGQRRTWKRARDAFWWKEMKDTVFNYVKGCQACGKNKYNLKPNRAPMAETVVPATPLEVLQVDFLGPFPASEKHPFRYILEIQDVLSRYVRFVPSEKNDAVTAAEILFEEWICTLGYPKKIGSDHGSHFATEVFAEACSMGGITHEMGAPYHHEAVGQVERQNQLVTQVRSMCENKIGIDEWPMAIVRMQLTHNTSINESSKFSPLELLTGHVPRDVTILMNDTKENRNKQSGDKIKYMHDKEKRLSKLIEEASTNIRMAQKKRNAKRRCRGKAYQEGDLVRLLVSVSDRGKQGGKKLAPLFSKVYVITEVLKGGWTFRLKPYNRKGREKVRHFNELVTAYVRDGTVGCKNHTSDDTSSSASDENSSSSDTEQDEHRDTDLPEDSTEPLQQEEPQSRSLRPRRATRPPTRLEMQWRGKVHGDTRRAYTDSSDY